MAANLMDLVRELKSLNARRKAGEALSPLEEDRRKELKSFLRTTLESSGGGPPPSTEDSSIKEKPTTRAPVPRSVSVPDPAPLAPKPVERSNPPRPVPMAVMPGAAIPAPAPMSSARGAPSVMPSVSTTSSNPPVMVDLQAPAAKSAPKPYVPNPNAFAINASVADLLIGDAMKSDAVNKVDPWANRKAHASQAELEDSAARADAAIRANKKRPRAATPEEVLKELKESEGNYTPSEDALTFEQYYGEYADSGYSYVDAKDAGDLKPIDPNEVELQRAGLAAGSVGAVTVPRGLAFIDDFPVLYSKRLLPPPEDEVVSDSDDPMLIVPGKRKVTVHLMNGEKRQGQIRQLRRGELGFKLEPMGSGSPEEMSITQCRAVFIHLNNNSQPKPAIGRALTVTFNDGRSAQGTSDDYQPGAPVFSIVPPVGRGQFERVIINGSWVKAIS